MLCSVSTPRSCSSKRRARGPPGGHDSLVAQYDQAVNAADLRAATSSTFEPVLVTTKLHVPSLRADLVPRDLLVARLVSARERKLTVVSAPAGWGKSTLLGEWAASPEESRPFAWLSLDPADYDPVRFWSYVIAAIRSLHPELGAGPLVSLRSAGPDLADVVVAPLINELAALREPLVLVLDDYHLVRSELIHASLEFLLRHVPATLHLAVASREDLPFPIARLRAAGEVTELRAADLRFSDTEAEALLNGSLGLDLDSSDVERLRARTEGWAAGLQLAALSARTIDDRHSFVAELAGSDRLIGDYFRELLDDQPSSLRAFLLETSILERLCAPLCNAVTGRADCADQLEAADRSNLFLTSLDSRREWFRYHPLFGDLLRQELTQSSPELESELHRRASAWHGEHGNGDEAIRHATAAGDFGDASDLIARHWGPFWNLGQRETVAHWIDSLPSDAVLDDARICLARGWTAVFLGAFTEVEPWARAAELAPLPGPFYDGTASVKAVVARLRSVYAYFQGDVSLGIEQGRLAVTLSREEDPDSFGPACVVLGANLSFGGDPQEAAGLLASALPSLVPPRWVDARLAALGRLISIQAQAGEVEQAGRSAAEGERLIAELELHELPTTGILQIGRGELLELLGDVEAAEAAYRRAIVLARRGGLRLDLAQALLALARLERRRRRQDEARSLTREARAVIAACPDPGRLSELQAQTERALQLSADRRPAPALAVDAELSERELTVLRLLASDLSQREIGSELYISLNTVKGHTRSIFRKLGVSSRAEAVARGRELHLI